VYDVYNKNLPINERLQNKKDYLKAGIKHNSYTRV
jgi:hypothetical protein